MCSPGIPGPADADRWWDLTRGRLSHEGADRFFRLHKYAHKRWLRARDLRYSERWLKVLMAVARRAPDYLGLQRKHWN